ncbi:hypothetical protein MMC07_003800 [Pseudocyphellaria aurata]|nr:hypothetical protein [Pseudocyphellaria aurata]
MRFITGHLRENLLADNTATLYFIDGLIRCTPTQIPMYESAPPFLRFYDYLETKGVPDMIDEKEFVRLAAEHGFNGKIVAEDSLRNSTSFMKIKNNEAIPMAHEYIQQVMDEDGPFHGVIGASEGSITAASTLMRDLETCRKNNRKSSFRCGIFMVGFPAVDDQGRWILCDDGSGLQITVPTCHIIGEQDPVACAGIALMNTCEPKSRVLVSHEGGHLIPHEPEIMNRVGDFVRKVKAEG